MLGNSKAKALIVGSSAALMASLAMKEIGHAGLSEGAIVLSDDPYDDYLETYVDPKKKELQRMQQEVEQQLSRAPTPNIKKPDPLRQSAAEAKRARKAERLKALAEKGAIGVQKTTTTSADPFPDDKPVKKSRAKSNETGLKAPGAKDADKAKLPAKRKSPAKKKTT